MLGSKRGSMLHKETLQAKSRFCLQAQPCPLTLRVEGNAHHHIRCKTCKSAHRCMFFAFQTPFKVNPVLEMFPKRTQESSFAAVALTALTWSIFCAGRARTPTQGVANTGPAVTWACVHGPSLSNMASLRAALSLASLQLFPAG